MPDSTRASPTEWRKATLSEVATFINGYAFKPEDWSQQGLPIVRIAQMTNPTAGYDNYEGVLPAQYRIDKGDLLFSWSATLSTLIWDRGPAYLNQHLFKVVPALGTELAFLHHLLDFHMDALSGQAHGTTMRHIKRSYLLPFVVDLPPITEQRRIAEILDTLDESIRRTEQIIAKLKQIKQGLLHDLLTRGIDENGELRDLGRHPEQFKDSSMGRIPCEWQVDRLHRLAAADSPITYGVVQPGPRVPGGILFVRGGDFPNGEIEVEHLRTISRHVDGLYARTHLRGGEMLISLVGQPGSSAVVPESLAGANIARQVAMVRLSVDRSDPHFVQAFISSAIGQRALLGDTLGSVQQVVNLKELRQMCVPVPRPPEQDAIVTKIACWKEEYQAEGEYLGKLRLLKHGLMEDLLTGRVRATNLEAAA